MKARSVWPRHPLLCTPLGLSRSTAAGPSLPTAAGHTPSGPHQPKPRHLPCPPFASRGGKALMHDLAPASVQGDRELAASPGSPAGILRSCLPCKEEWLLWDFPFLILTSYSSTLLRQLLASLPLTGSLLPPTPACRASPFQCGPILMPGTRHPCGNGPGTRHSVVTRGDVLRISLLASRGPE